MMTQLENYIRNARFLIVDDQPANVALLEANLEDEGQLNYHSTTDSREVLELYKAFQPDIVLLDLMMPHLDGYAVMEQLRGIIPPDQNLPIVVLTADISPATRQRVLAAGARDFLTKPFDATELHLRTRNLLEMRFLHLGLQQQNKQLDAKVLERTQALEVAMAELQEAQRQSLQQARLHAFREMAGGVVHDFNNSLSILVGYSEILLTGLVPGDSPKAKKYLQTMNTAAQDATKVVNRLRDFYRTRAEDEALAPGDLTQLMEQASELSKPRWKDQALADGRNIDITLQLQAVSPILCHPAELREVLLNLIFNAVDAMPHGGHLTFRTFEKDGRVCCEISDTGTGMTEEVRQRCLEPFFSTKGDKGTGLGLAMVTGIIRRHLGEVDIDSELGRGTTFRLTFPRQEEAAAQFSTSAPVSMRPLRILFADDDQHLREIVSQQLEAEGHTVIATKDGAEALELFTPGGFDVVLTDLSMPRMNGHQLASAVKKADRDVPVIMITGFGAMLLPEDGKPEDIDVLLSKPVTFGGLTSAIQQVARQPAA